MAMRILDGCSNCGACERECPTEAISSREGRTEIDPGRCAECVGVFGEPRCLKVCPEGSVGEDPQRRETGDELLARSVWLSME